MRLVEFYQAASARLERTAVGAPGGSSAGWRAAGREFSGGCYLETRKTLGYGLRTIEADLNAGGVKGVEGLVVQDHVTEGIQQAAGEILQAAEQLQRCPSELGRQVAQQTAGSHQLLDHVGDLQQVVVGFELFRVDAENVFQVEAAVLLAIEALVLNVPAVSSSFRGDVIDGMGVDLEVRDPGERGGFALHRFLAFDGVKPPGSPLVIPIGQAVDPAVDLVNASGHGAFQRVFGTQLQKTLKIRPDGRHVAWLEGEHVVAVIVLGQLQGPAAGIETVTGKTQAQLREIPTELGKQPAERLEFTILFVGLAGQGGIAVRVFDELAGHGQGQTGWAEQFGFQDLMQIHGVSGMTVDQTLRAMRLAKREMTSCIQDHDKSPLQAGGVQDPHANEAAQHVGP